MLISGGEGSETLHTCPSVPQSHGLVKVEQGDLCHREEAASVAHAWPKDKQRGHGVWIPKEERSSHLTPWKERRWVEEDTYPSRAPDRMGGLVTETLVSWVGLLEDMALCPPFLAGHSLLSPAPGRQGRSLIPLLDPGTLQPGLEPHLCSLPQGGALPTLGNEKGESHGCSNAERPVPQPPNLKDWHLGTLSGISTHITIISP